MFGLESKIITSRQVGEVSSATQDILNHFRNDS